MLNSGPKSEASNRSEPHELTKTWVARSWKARRGWPSGLWKQPPVVMHDGRAEELSSLTGSFFPQM